MPAPASDVELLEAWRGGDRQAGQRLFERHYGSVARFFQNKVDAGIDDLIQRTFLACVESKERMRGEASFRTFLFAVARNLLSKHYRGKRSDGEHVDFGVTSVHDLGPSPSVVIAEHQEQRALLEALRRIPLEHQIILELYYWERLGHSNAENGAAAKYRRSSGLACRLSRPPQTGAEPAGPAARTSL